MNIENDMTFREEALDIFEQAENLSSEQLAALLNSSELQDDVMLIHNVQETMRKDSPVDVEARLQLFHARHDEKGTGENAISSLFSHNRTLIVSLFSIAAMFFGAIFYLNMDKKDDVALPQGMVFSADIQRSGISIVNENGDEVSLAPSQSQSRSITLTDFQEVLAEVGVSEKLTLNVPFGSSADITLPDGTVVYMHPGAKLIFPSRFTGDYREVVFHGEAYFKVAKDAQHPFVITSDNMETTVLGTEFNINTELNNVALVSGSVRLRETSSNAHVMLQPNQQATLSAESKHFDVSPVDVEPYEFWRDGYLYFDQTELKDIMEAIGKNFNMSVVFKNDKALHYRMRFITLRNKGVEAAINTMNEMKKVNVTIRGNVIYVN